MNNKESYGIEYALKFVSTAIQATAVNCNMYNEIFNNIHTAINPSSSIGGIVVTILSDSGGETTLNMTKISFQSNKYYNDEGGAVYINHNSDNRLLFSECEICEQ